MLKFLRNESGATAIEYVLIASAMTICLMGAMPFIETALSTKLINIGAQLSSAG